MGESDSLESKGHPLDSQEAQDEHRKLMDWYRWERNRQSANRLEMAMDADFYDSIQWDPEDAAELKGRGQMPLVFNELAPMCDWLIGTERRARVDWKVLPRTEDDLEMSDIKTKLMKYVSDVNRVPFLRSRAFADAIKVGVGWMDDGARDDPTKDVLYSKYEDWRNVLWDSLSYELDLSDARYIFRDRWPDLDVACAMIPERADKIKLKGEENPGSRFDGEDLGGGSDIGSGRYFGIDTSEGVRKRVKLIECQYRKPARVQVVTDGPFKGQIVDAGDATMTSHLQSQGGTIVDKVMMVMHVAIFTETYMLSMGQSMYRHNSFSLTPVWCYRGGKNRLPYGPIRRGRDLQQDLNKRASKAQFLLNSNQVIADEGAVEDWEVLRDEVARPDGLIVKKAGKELKIHRDTDAATGQIQMMTLDAQNIQKSVGVPQENLGRQSNAVSGEAIKARQNQGSVVTTEPFDNARLATQIQGEKQMSLVEQYYTEEKVIRLTGHKGKLEWLRVNTPEQQVDGTVRYLNDVTASVADFVVSEQDYAGTLRQGMFESLNQMAQRLPPDIALRLMTVAMDFSDLPNKDQVVEEFRKITGERDDNKPLSPEETQKMQEQMQQQAEALQMQRETAINMLKEQQGKVREINARAAKLEAETAGAAGGAPGAGADHGVIDQIKRDASAEIDRLSAALRKAQSDAANKTMQITRDADVKLEVARIDADSKIRTAEIGRASDKTIEAISKRLDGVLSVLSDVSKHNDQLSKDLQRSPVPLESAPAAPAPVPPAQPIEINVTVDATSGAVKKSIGVVRDGAGRIVGAEITEGKESQHAPQ